MSVTIASFTFDYSRSGATGYLRSYNTSESYEDPDGMFHPAQTAGGRDYMEEVAFTVASNVATVPTFTHPVTWDEASGARASVTFLILDANRNKVGILVSDFRIPPVPSTTTWGALLTFNADIVSIRDTDTYTKTQVNYLLEQNTAVGNPATTSTLGRVKMSVAPVDAAAPIAVGDNDPRLDGWVNVKGSPYNAVGDGVTDDYAALQAAIDDAGDERGTVFLPLGDYYISEPLVITKPIVIRGCSSVYGSYVSGLSTVTIRGTRLKGDFNDYLIKFSLAGIWGGSSVQDMWLKNDGATGGAIYLSDSVAPAYFGHLQVNAYRGITTTNQNFTTTIEDVSIKGGPTPWASGGWGIYSRSHTQVISADISSYEHGIRATGSGLCVVGGRFEENIVGFMLGQMDDGSTSAVSSASLSGFTMEVNIWGIYIKGATSYTVQSFAILGGNYGPVSGDYDGQSRYGIYSEAAAWGTFQSGVVSGTYSKAGILTRGESVFQSVTASGNTLGANWDISNPQSSTFANTDYTLKDDGTQTPNVTATQIVRSIAAADQVRGAKQGKNLRGINVPVTSGSTFVDIAFPVHNAGSAVIDTATATGSGNTLPAGTYYYIATIVNEIGETQAASEKTVVVTAGQRVDLTFFAAAGTQWRRRIYRGTASGVYDGYFETAVASSATFSDTGQAFTGKRIPPTTNGADGTEPDANYAAVCTPAWATTCYVTGKATTGFRINFGTAPGSDSTLDWIIVR